MRVRKKALSVWICGLVMACAPDAERVEDPGPSSSDVEVVNGLIDAFNEHDAASMRAFWHDDVVWIEVAGNQSRAVTTSADQLEAELVAYFERFPDVRSEIDQMSVNGDYIAAIETATWSQSGDPQSQSSHVVYQLTDKKVKRFWYFPPQ